MDKNKIIEQAYHDPLGYGSVQNTLRDAKKQDPSITLDDVKKWKDENVEQAKQHPGYSSFVAYKPYEEFQVCLFIMPDHKYKVGMLRVDIFTKSTEVIPIMDKTDGSTIAALMEDFPRMGGKPETVYSDDDPALSPNYTKVFHGKWHSPPDH